MGRRFIEIDGTRYPENTIRKALQLMRADKAQDPIEVEDQFEPTTEDDLTQMMTFAYMYMATAKRHGRKIRIIIESLGDKYGKRSNENDNGKGTSSKPGNSSSGGNKGR